MAGEISVTPIRPPPPRSPEVKIDRPPTAEVKSGEVPAQDAQTLATSLESGQAAGIKPEGLLEQLRSQREALQREAAKTKTAEPSKTSTPEKPQESTERPKSAKPGETTAVKPAEQPTAASKPTEAAETPDASQEYVDRYIQQGIQSWEQQHPEPDSSANPTEYSKWAHARIEIRAKLAIDAKVGQDLQAWEKDNPRPDKEKDPKAFEAWLEKRLEQESTSRGKHASNEQQNAPESSEAEILVKANRLRELYMQRANLAEGIALLNSKASKTNEESQKLNALRIQKDQVDNAIGLLEKELMGEARRSPLKAGVIIMAIMGGLMATLAARGSKG